MSRETSPVFEFLRRGTHCLKSLIETLRVRQMSHELLLEAVEPAPLPRGAVQVLRDDNNMDTLALRCTRRSCSSKACAFSSVSD